MKNQIIILITFYMTIGFANCQYKDYQCASVIRDAQNKCVKNYDCYTADSLLLKANYYLENPPDERCLNHYGYFVTLSSFYQSVLESRNCSIEQVIYALDKAIELILKAGELKPVWLSENGEGAQKLISLYSLKSKVYFDLKDQQQYDIAIEQIKYWKQVYNGPVKQIDHTIPPNTTIYSKKDTLHGKPIVSPSIEKRFISKHIVVLAQNKKQIVDRKSELITLTDEHLSIHFDSDIQITLSDNPSRYKYKLLFEENVQHQVLIKHPGYEEQFFEFISTQVPQYDTLFVIMYPVETPLYYTKWNKRSFQPDSFSIVIIRNRYGSKEAFETLIKDLNLKRSSPNASVFYKESGEVFNQKKDSVITELRLQKSLVEIAGYNFGTRDRISILTNQFRIIWNKKSSDMSKEELSEIKAIIHEYQLIEKENGLFEAPLGIGLELNTIIQKLNQVKCVRTAYPELYQPLYH